MYVNDHFRGRLFSASASLLFFISDKVMKWQFPALAAAEALSHLAIALRSIFLPGAPQLFRR